MAKYLRNLEQKGTELELIGKFKYRTTLSFSPNLTLESVVVLDANENPKKIIYTNP